MNRYFGVHVLDGEWHALLPRYLMLADRVDGKRVLDIGCATGIGSSMLVEMGAERVDAIDTRLDLLNLAEIKHAKENLQFYPMDWRELDFDDDSFDLVVGLDPEGPVTDPRLLEEIERVLADGGEYVCAIERRTVGGLEEVLPRHDGGPPTVDDLERDRQAPQVGELSRHFARLVRVQQRPQLGWIFRENGEEESGDDSGRDALATNGDEAGRDALATNGDEAGRDALATNGDEAGRDALATNGDEAGRDALATNGDEAGRDALATNDDSDQDEAETTGDAEFHPDFVAEDQDAPPADFTLCADDTDEAAVELLFCGDESLEAPSPRDVRMPYYRVAERLNAVLQDMQFRRPASHTTPADARDDLASGLQPSLPRSGPDEAPDVEALQNRLEQMSGAYDQVRQTLHRMREQTQAILDHQGRSIERLLSEVRRLQASAANSAGGPGRDSQQDNENTGIYVFPDLEGLDEEHDSGSMPAGLAAETPTPQDLDSLAVPDATDEIEGELERLEREREQLEARLNARNQHIERLQAKMKEQTPAQPDSPHEENAGEGLGESTNPEDAADDAPGPSAETDAGPVDDLAEDMGVDSSAELPIDELAGVQSEQPGLSEDTNATDATNASDTTSSLDEPTSAVSPDEDDAENEADQEDREDADTSEADESSEDAGSDDAGSDDADSLEETDETDESAEREER